MSERIALHVSALGWAMLARLPKADAARQLRLKPMRRVTDRSPASVSATQADINKQRKRGWVLADGESVVGVTAHAMTGFVGNDLIGLSVAGPSERLERNRAEYITVLQGLAASATHAPV